MNSIYVSVGIHLGSAWVAGSLVGLERSFHGRPAGFRTHALVCVASALLMLVTVYQWDWLGAVPLETVRTDPTRMAQGIMTGIGFLGAGVIFKEGLTVRGLTTAASIWMTAALGILYGIGFYFPALVATVIAIGTLSVFRFLEYRMPSQFYAHQTLKFSRDKILDEANVRKLMSDMGFQVTTVSYRLVDDGAAFEYRLVTSTIHKDNLTRLACALRERDDVLEFRISPAGD